MTIEFSDLLESGRGGVYRTHAPISAGALDAVLERGAQVAEIALQGVRDKKAFLNAIASELGFPDYFGHNWDAFHECLTDLEQASGAGLVVVLRKASGFARAEPDEFATAVDALRDAADFWKTGGGMLLAVLELEAPVLAPELPEISPRQA